MEQFRQLGQDILKYLYRHRGMTVNQIRTVVNRNKTTVYNTLSKLSKVKLIEKRAVPFLGRGTKVYYLTAEGAKVVSEQLREDDRFNKKEWTSFPDNLLTVLTVNQFHCELIKGTLEEVEAGIIDWYGPDSTADKYGQEKSLTKVPDSYAVFQLPESKGRLLLHTVVFSGDETAMVIEDCLKNFSTILKEYWMDQIGHVSILFLVHVPSQIKRIVDIWHAISMKNMEKNPTIAVAAYQEVIQKGVFSPVWNVEGTMKSIDTLPTLPHETISIDGFIGKFEAFPFFSTEQLGIEKELTLGKSKDNSTETDAQLEVPEGRNDDINENGIDWSIS